MAYFFKYNSAVVKVFVFLVHVQLVSEKAFLKLLAIDTKNL